MGTFATKKILQGNPSLIPVIAEQIKTEFAAEQFEVHHIKEHPYALSNNATRDRKSAMKPLPRRCG